MPLFDTAEGSLIEPCRYYPSDFVQPVLAKWQPDEALAKRHWPWVAAACYHWEAAHRLGLKPSLLRPVDVRASLGRIDKHAGSLSKEVYGLLAAARSRAPADGSHPDEVAGILERLGAGAAGDNVPPAGALTSLMALCQQLAGLQGAVEALTAGNGPELTARKKSGEDPALPNFVATLAQVWRSLTGRKPSTRKVERSIGEEPDFVLFVQDVAKLVVEPPSELTERISLIEPVGSHLPPPTGALAKAEVADMAARRARRPGKLPTLDAIATALEHTHIPSQD